MLYFLFKSQRVSRPNLNLSSHNEGWERAERGNQTKGRISKREGHLSALARQLTSSALREDWRGIFKPLPSSVFLFGTTQFQVVFVPFLSPLRVEI